MGLWFKCQIVFQNFFMPVQKNETPRVVAAFFRKRGRIHEERDGALPHRR